MVGESWSVLLVLCKTQSTLLTQPDDGHDMMLETTVSSVRTSIQFTLTWMRHTPAVPLKLKNHPKWLRALCSTSKWKSRLTFYNPGGIIRRIIRSPHGGFHMEAHSVRNSQVWVQGGLDKWLMVTPQSLRDFFSENVFQIMCF